VNEQRKGGRYRNFVQVACWLTQSQRDALRKLSAKTGLPQQTHIREAINDLVAKHEAHA
jgi:predicted DNA-binding protein